MKPQSIFAAFLAALGVPHTQAYSDRQFSTMTFRSLFGFSKLLQSYGIPNEAFQVPDKATDLPLMPVPFLAQVADNFAIVSAVGKDTVAVSNADNTAFTAVPTATFLGRWSGVALVAYPTRHSAEPDYRRHHILDIAQSAKKWILAACALFIFAYLFVASQVYTRPASIALVVISLVGIYAGYELVLKSLNIHSSAGNAICGLIDRTGCHTVLSTKASKFFGLFGWAEVGLSYFAVTLATLLVFPQYTPYLAAINALCCPFSFWSIWYQKYRAKAWCTLCLISQGCLWLSLAAYLCGGFFHGIFPLGLPFFVLGASYVATLLAVTAVTSLIDKIQNSSSND